MEFKTPAYSTQLVIILCCLILSGHQIGLRNVNSGEMQFITLGDSVEQVTCISLTPSKKYLFVFEQHRD
jgi:hypothetical protein